MTTTPFERMLARYCPIILVFGGALIGPTPAAGQSPLAIVVHRESTLENISLDELRRLFQGRSTTLGGVPGVALYQHTSSRARFYTQALNETLSRATRAWIALVFSGGAAVPPTDVERASDLVQAVAGKPSALGVVPYSEVDTQFVRVLRVDGLSVDASAYPLR